MKQTISTIEVKRLNRNRVFRYLNSRERTSMPDVAADLGMSTPTVLQMVKELKELGIIEEAGAFESTGGRKAKAIAPVHNACYSLGVDITRNHVSMVLTNLSKKVLKHIRIRKPFVDSDSYFKELSQLINEFYQEAEISDDKIAGIGFSIPGIVDVVNNRISYSHILNLRDVDGRRLEDYISMPYVMINDANAAALTEHVARSYSGNMVYLSLSNTVGGGVILGGEKQLASTSVKGYDHIFKSMYVGDEWRSGEFGHMTIDQSGPACYCGKKGCLDAYCSSAVLTAGTNGNLERFFDGLTKGDTKCQKVWEEYTDYLAVAVDNLYMSFNCDIILGGYVGSYMDAHIQAFHDKVKRRNIFGHSGEYVRTCRYKIEASALGAALYQIEKYINAI